ncbi:hypothetical protein DMN91_006329 [Ooceraea biroi]|uniref:Uridine 5'-monophosphate synthase n=1 Tax=Ooceraea biroi TaxID=2015173 RepID=A0A026VYJ3_OOCBI|nr:uridine 5'-monophosphate synthase [Ooceraea biroi]XP_011347387.1 uridine 5'-monophosphate synthase [Ooceraea biroi]XP_011347388.1 uridine 5'-monophosphate synthase [Ooceraea biroi]XP_011347389.1 uridine 5'-monophosphate synthase [Ooceraea biroi]XP_011347391.1 uridine 5'-monophosphate synthase [Ooceraea biroi]EZA48873.1 Uridine 5'-monophosphate synthase [Ooceraea biroi]RLU21950.1 hypothetical protein DMN91_006329 [Ooceraea biroi]
MEESLKQRLAMQLYDIQVLKFGEYKTKIGLRTPVYFDLRMIISYPDVMSSLAKALWALRDPEESVNRICGVPYTALPLATLIAAHNDVPMLMKRKEAKSYGTKKMIEGVIEPRHNCVIIEDVVTSGSSVLETADALRKEGLVVTDAFVIIDREQGGRKNLENHGIRVRSLYTITQIVQYLHEAGKITAETVKDVQDYLATNQAPVIHMQGSELNDRLKLSYGERAKKTSNPLTSKLLELMESKQTNLCLAADLTRTDAILRLADAVGPHIAVLKIHVNIIEDFSERFVTRLKEAARLHNFLLMEDCKFGDIGNTVLLQYRHGLYKIAEWADLITVHLVSGASVVNALRDGLKGITEPRGVFVVAEMSSQGALTVGDYMKSAVSIAEKTSDLVVGLVCQSNLSARPEMLQLTPGVHLSSSGDGLGQQYNDPQSVINAGADLAVVGRGITESSAGWLKAALDYKQPLWEAYEKRVGRRKV